MSFNDYPAVGFRPDHRGGVGDHNRRCEIRQDIAQYEPGEFGGLVVLVAFDHCGDGFGGSNLVYGLSD